MSSIDQNFVKAFARRNRPSQQTAPEKQPSAQEESVVPAPHIRLAAQPPLNDSMRIDPSVESSVEVWIDPKEDRLVRVDNLRRDPVPAPHSSPKPEESGEVQRANETPPAAVDGDAVPSTKDVALSIQQSLDLLQHSFSTLESAIEPAEDLSNLYADSTSAPVATGQVATEIEPFAPAERPNRESSSEPAIVQHRIDAPVEYPASTGRTDQEAPAEDASTPPAFEGDQGTDPVEPQILRAVWEVDVFDVPAAVADLFFEGPLFQQVAERVLQAVHSGLSSMMVTSVRQGEGRSTVAIGMAMAAAAAGLRVALIDADTEDPTLVDDLRLDLQYGWVDTVRGGLAIREVAVHAVEDGVTLIPLMKPNHGGAATDYEVVQLLESLRDKFDLVVVDTPSFETSESQPSAAAIDSALIVRDAAKTDADAVNELSYRLREKGVQGVGVVDNFA